MDQEFLSDRGSRAARARERRVRRRRRRVVVLAAALLGAAVVAGGVLAAGRGLTLGGVFSGGAGQGGDDGVAAAPPLSSPSAAVSPSPLPSPSPTPEPPPLERPSKKDPYRVYFGGDSLAGLPGELFAILGRKNGLMKVHTDYQVSSRLTNPDPVDWPAHLQAELEANRPELGVFMIGVNDPGMPMLAEGEATMYPKKAWLEEYGRRADRLMKLMLRAGVRRVYWVGMPVMPEKGQTSQMKRLNELFKAAAAKHPDVVYVDTFALLKDGKGRFDPAVRSGDGVHFTNEGAGRIVDAVWEAMKEDWRAP